MLHAAVVTSPPLLQVLFSSSHRGGLSGSLLSLTGADSRPQESIVLELYGVTEPCELIVL